jgi:hypothetical protein
VAGLYEGVQLVSKFRIKFKLQGMELEVEGSREDLPVLRQALTHQIAGALNPATELAGGELKNVTPLASASASGPGTRTGTSRKGRKGKPSNNNSATATEPLDFRHEPDKFGSPRQSWSTGKKALWLMYVVASITEGSELSAAALAATFRKHFKQSGPIQPGHTARDLGKLKSATKEYPVALVVEDTTRETSTWSLTEAGTRAAQALVAEAKGGSAPSA